MIPLPNHYVLFHIDSDWSGSQDVCQVECNDYGYHSLDCLYTQIYIQKRNLRALGTYACVYIYIYVYT